MEINKKGVFFTFIALFIIILVVAVVTTKDTYRYRERSNAISSRVKTMNNFIQDFEEDLERELFIGGYRALISMNSYVRQIQDKIILVIVNGIPKYRYRPEKYIIPTGSNINPKNAVQIRFPSLESSIEKKFDFISIIYLKCHIWL